MNNISFHGFRNAGVEKFVTYTYSVPSILSGSVPKDEFISLNCELTNSNGKDLDKFSSIFAKATNLINKNFFNIVLCKHKKNEEDLNPIRMFSINDEIFPVNMENIPVFQKVVDLLIKITQTKNSDFIVCKDYLEGDDFYDSFLSVSVDTDEETAKNIHDPENVKAVAQTLIDVLTEEFDEALS